MKVVDYEEVMSMMIMKKVINNSKYAVDIVISDDTSVVVKPGEYVMVDKLTSQMRRLEILGVLSVTTVATNIEEDVKYPEM